MKHLGKGLRVTEEMTRGKERVKMMGGGSSQRCARNLDDAMAVAPAVTTACVNTSHRHIVVTQFFLYHIDTS